MAPEVSKALSTWSQDPGTRIDRVGIGSDVGQLLVASVSQKWDSDPLLLGLFQGKPNEHQPIFIGPLLSEPPFKGKLDQLEDWCTIKAAQIWGCGGPSKQSHEVHRNSQTARAVYPNPMVQNQIGRDPSWSFISPSLQALPKQSHPIGTEVVYPKAMVQHPERGRDSPNLGQT